MLVLMCFDLLYINHPTEVPTFVSASRNLYNRHQSCYIQILGYNICAIFTYPGFFLRVLWKPGGDEFIFPPPSAVLGPRRGFRAEVSERGEKSRVRVCQKRPVQQGLIFGSWAKRRPSIQEPRKRTQRHPSWREQTCARSFSLSFPERGKGSSNARREYLSRKSLALKRHLSRKATSADRWAWFRSCVVGAYGPCACCFDREKKTNLLGGEK